MEAGESTVGGGVQTGATSGVGATEQPSPTAQAKQKSQEQESPGHAGHRTSPLGHRAGQRGREKTQQATGDGASN